MPEQQDDGGRARATQGALGAKPETQVEGPPFLRGCLQAAAGIRPCPAVVCGGVGKMLLGNVVFVCVCVCVS